MSPDARSANPTVRPAPRDGRPPAPSRRPRRAPSALEALSAASLRYARDAGTDHPPRPGSSWLLAFAAAVIVGAALTLAAPFEHVCAATLYYTGENPQTDFPRLRNELLDFAGTRTQETSVEHRAGLHWYVDAPAEQVLRLCLLTRSRQNGVARVRNVAQSYLAYTKSEQAKARALPTERERLLSEYAAQFETRLDRAQTQLQDSLASVADDDPHQQREALLNKWQRLRTQFESVRAGLAEASATFERLENEPEPSHGIVPSEQRRAALDADLGLQQDLRELHVYLTELKLQLLKVWRASSQPLEQLLAAADELDHTMSREEAPDKLSQRTLVSLATEATLYGQALSAFTQSWTKDFAALQQIAIDPLSDGLLNLHQRVRSRLNDFLFEAGKRLSAMRTSVQTIGQQTGDQARFHVLQSNLMRSFRVAQSAHHRYEFAAGAIEARDNFQLDSSLRGARGLRRRTQQRIRLIDERLQKKATRQAKEQRIRDLARAERDVEQLRASADETIVELVSLQDKLNLNAGLTEEFLQAVLRSEIAKQRIETTQADLAETRGQLDELVSRRTSRPNDINLELVECGVIAPMVNLPERLRFAALAAIATFLTVAVGQWWIARRATPRKS